MQLTAGEIEVMKILWEHAGEMSPPEIEERFARPIKNAALRFQLKVLLEKGHVSRRRVGKTYYYKAVTQRGRTFKSMARRMADIFFGGSAAGLIAELIKTEKLSQKEIQDLEQLAKGKKNEKLETRN